MCLRRKSNSDRKRSGTQTGHTTKSTAATSVSSLYAAVLQLRLKSVRANSTDEPGPSFWKEMHDHERKMSEETLGKKQKSRASERGSADSTVEYNRELGGMPFEAPVITPEAAIDLPETVRLNDLGMPLNAREIFLLEMPSRERRGVVLFGVLGTAKCPDPPEELATAGEEVGSFSATTPKRPRLLERALWYACVRNTIRNHAAIKPNGNSALRVSAVTFEPVMHLEGTTNDKTSRFTQLKTLIHSHGEDLEERHQALEFWHERERLEVHVDQPDLERGPQLQLRPSAAFGVALGRRVPQPANQGEEADEQADDDCHNGEAGGKLTSRRAHCAAGRVRLLVEVVTILLTNLAQWAGTPETGEYFEGGDFRVDLAFAPWTELTVAVAARRNGFAVGARRRGSKRGKRAGAIDAALGTGFFIVSPGLAAEAFDFALRRLVSALCAEIARAARGHCLERPCPARHALVGLRAKLFASGAPALLLICQFDAADRANGPDGPIYAYCAAVEQEAERVISELVHGHHGVVPSRRGRVDHLGAALRLVVVHLAPGTVSLGD
eukprot:scaffold31862_cov63-Phaeocystis_antarctica.AAC.12